MNKKFSLFLIASLILIGGLVGAVNAEAACTLTSIDAPANLSYISGASYDVTISVGGSDTCGTDGAVFTGYYLFDSDDDGDFSDEGSYQQFGQISPALDSTSYVIDWNTTARTEGDNTRYKIRVVASGGASPVTLTPAITYGIDNTAPVILSAETLDAVTVDGAIDTIRVTFTEGIGMDQTNTDITGWYITANDGENAYTINSINWINSTSMNIVFGFEGTHTTSKTPQVGYDGSGTSDDVAGNEVTTTSIANATDMAAPYVVITAPLTTERVTSADTVSFTSSELTAAQCSTDNIAWEACTSGVYAFSDNAEFVALGEEVTFTLYVKDTDGGANVGTDSEADLVKDTTAPTLDSSVWSDVSGDKAIGATDTILFTFSEEMDSSTITAANVVARLAGAKTFGTTGNGMGISWNGAETELTVTLGTDSDIADGDAFDPAGTVTDTAGNADNTVAAPTVEDNLGPVIAEDTVVPTPTNDTLPPYTFTSTEAGASVAYGGLCTHGSIDTAVAGDNVLDFQTNHAGDPLGAANYNNCTITVTDAAGNASNVLNVTAFVIEVTPPTLLTAAWTDNDGSTSINAGDEILFTFSEAINQTTITDVNIDTALPLVGVGTTYGTTPTLSWNAEELTVTLGVGADIADGDAVDPAVTVLDLAGNADATAGGGPTIEDNLGPVIAEDTVVPTPTNDTLPPYTFTSTEAGASVAYGGLCTHGSIDTAVAGDNALDFQTNHAGDPLGAANYNNCTITVTDAAGNASNVLNVTAFVIDLTGPTVNITAPVGADEVNATKVITFTDTELTDAECSVDNAAWTNCTTGVTTLGDISEFAGLAEGAFTLYLRDTDSAGNPGTDNEALIIKDTLAPTGYSIGIVQAYVNNANKAVTSFTFAGAEVGSTYNYSISTTGAGGPVTSSGVVGAADETIAGIDVTGLGDGTLTYSVTLTDVAGNLGDAVTDTVVKDVANPASAVTIANALYGSTTYVANTVNGTASDVGGTGVSSVTITIQEGAGDYWTGTDWGVSTPLPVVGTDTWTYNSGTAITHTDTLVYTVTPTATDTAGNSVAGTADTYTWDGTVPTISNYNSNKADGSYKAGVVIDVDVTFSEAVTTASPITLTLDSGGTCVIASVSNSSTATCDYTVGAGHTSADLTVSNFSAAGAVVDQSGNIMVSFTPTGNNLAANKAFIIDTTAPGVSMGTEPGTKAVAWNQNTTVTDTNMAGIVYAWTATLEPYTVTFGTAAAEDTTISAGGIGYYTVQLTATDLAGNVGTGTVSFTWTSTNVPISSYSPINGATGVAIAAGDATITFGGSENITLIDATKVTIVKDSDGSDVANGAVSVSGASKILLVPHDALANSTVYRINILAGAIRDATGHINSDGVSYFTTVAATGDTTSPTLTTITPATVQTTGSVSPIVFAFADETAFDATASNNVVQFTMDGATVAGVPVVSGAGNTVLTITYTNAALGVGVHNFNVRVKDLAGNWTTDSAVISVVATPAADQTSPVSVSMAPLTVKTNGDAMNVQFVFSDTGFTGASGDIAEFSMDGAPIAGAIVWATPLLTINYTTGTWTTGTHNFTIKVVDATGNWISKSLAVDVVAAGATDATIPTIEDYGPDDDATSVAVDSYISVLFSEVMDSDTCLNTNVHLWKTSGDDTEININDVECSSTFTLDGVEKTAMYVTPTSDLLNGEIYSLVIDNTVTDWYGNPFAGLAVGTYSFTTVSEATEPDAGLTVDTMLTNTGVTNGLWDEEDGSAGDAYEWVFGVTLPNDEGLFALQFSDWTNGLDIDTGVMRYWSEQVEAGDPGSATNPVLITAADTYPTNISIGEDSSDLWENGGEAGLQTNIHVQLQIPSATPAGSHSTSFRIRSVAP